MKTIIISFFLILLITSNSLFAQCSDAGACQIGYSHADQNKLQLSFSYTNGYSGKDDDVRFHSLNLNAQYKVFEKSSLALLLPYNFQSGPGGDVNGIGDLILSWSQTLIEAGSSSLTASLGLKLATGDENKEPMLPQIYQPGLGSNDLILTLDYNYEKLGIGAGYQLAGGRNDKEGVRLKRGDDLIVRSSYNFSFVDFSITPQLLLIKRLSESSVLDLNSPGENFIEVEGSDQTQLNFIVNLKYNLSKNYSVFAEAAVPFLERDVNIDGLKRAYTVAAGIRFTIN